MTKSLSQNLPFICVALICMSCFSSVKKPKQASSGEIKNIGDTISNHMQTKNATPGYPDKNDPICITITGRAITDLKQSIKRSDPKLPENKLMATKMKAWPKAKQDQLQALAKKSIGDYIAHTHLNSNMETYLLIVSGFGEMDQKRIAEEYAIRVQYLGGDKYVAEFWEDGLAVNSEAHALDWANKLAKRFPDDKGMVKDVREKYAAIRKTIETGKKERYTKLMALLYSREKDGSISFHDPGQPMFDFINR